MGYWPTAVEFAWRETRLFTPSKALPSILAALYMALREGGTAMNRAVGASVVLVGAYSVLAVLEFFYKLLVNDPHGT